ncbi:MAG: hypothetical protein U0528_03130 [Anaerolineae bacterium]
MTTPTWTTEQLLQQAQSNSNAFALATLAYFQQQGQPSSEVIRFIGESFAAGWGAMQGHGAAEIAGLVAFNFASLGGSLVALLGNDRHATITINFPVKPLTDAFGIALEDYDRSLAMIFQTILGSLNFKLTTRRDNDNLIYELAAR